MTDGTAATGQAAPRRTGSAWYERYSWVVFVLVGLSGLVPAAQLLVDPLSGTGYFAQFGHPVPDSILADPSETAFLAFAMQWIGGVLAGENLFTLAIAVTAWRDGHRWAWLVMWYWPVLFASHYVTYGPGLLKTLQLVWVALLVLVLASNYRRFFSSPAPTTTGS